MDAEGSAATAAPVVSPTSTYRGEDSYKGIVDKDGKAFGGGWTRPQFVLTHHAPERPLPGVTFAGDLAGGVAAALA